MSNDLPQEYLKGVPGFPDTFFGSESFDGKYLDRLTLDMIKLRGCQIFIYKKLDAPSRTDGDRPLSNNPNLGPFDVKGHSGSEVAALYGEPMQLYQEVNTIVKNVAADWNYAPPIEHRGVLYQPSQSDVADERGHIENHKITLNLARALCEIANYSPEIGDIVRLPTLLNDYFDVNVVTKDAHRFGASGFFTSYTLELTKTSKYEAQRKNLPDKSL